MSRPEFSDFRLVGGTSLALQIGHRTSVDIDFFTDRDFDSRELQLFLEGIFPGLQIIWQGRNGFSALLNKVKADICNWRVPFVLPTIVVDSLRLMDKLEIGAMKLDTITTRKEKKDFIDLFFLLQHFSLAELLDIFQKKYPYLDYKFVLESLNAVDLADKTEEPRMLVTFNWEKVKKEIIVKVESHVKELKKSIEAKQEERLRQAEEMLKKKKKN